MRASKPTTRPEGGQKLDTQTIINLGAGALLAVAGWLARELWVAVKLLREDLHRLEIDLPKNYTSKDDFSAAMDKVSNGLQRIYDKLDGKADKS